MRPLERWLLSTRIRAWLLRRIEAPRLLPRLHLPPNPRCLEIGCGNGVGAMVLSARLHPDRLVCTDIDPDMLRRARRMLASPPRWARGADTSQIELLQADAADLPFADASFDAVFLFGVLHHIRDWPAALAETYRLLPPGGVFAFSEALLGGSPLLLNRFWRHVPFGRDELSAALEDAGFRIERFRTIAAGMWCFVIARRP